MDKEIVVLVPTEAAAYEVVKALKDLDFDGSIELYSSTVVVKTSTGAITIKDGHHLRGGLATALGVSTGALIGLLAGPVGAAVGAAIGGAAGLGSDLAYSGFAGDFVHDVAVRLEPGAHAVCASIWEDWTVPVDVALAPFGGTVFRQATDDIVVAHIRSDMQALKEENAHLEAEIARTNGAMKTTLEAKRSEIKTKSAAQRERLEKRVNKLLESWDAKIESIREKALKAKAEAKARHLQHVEKLTHFAAEQKASFKELFA